jgi:hypothetical protein
MTRSSGGENRTEKPTRVERPGAVNKTSYEKERKNLQDRIKDKCAGMNLDANQQEELEMAHDYAKKDFPEKPEYAK